MSLGDYPDMWDHVETLREHDKLVQMDRRVNKDTELHPIVRWQYRGGIPPEERRAFLFTDVVDSRGTEFDIPVVVAALGGSPEIYGLGLDVEPERVNQKWDRALDDPVEPTEVSSADAPAHEIVHSGDELEREGNGLEGVPVPVSTPGWDNAPYTTASYTVSHHPETGIRNIGTYRAQVKSSDRTGMNPSTEGNKDLYEHWTVAKERGEHLPVAICLSAPPCVGYASVQRMPPHLDELAVAGGLVDEPVREVEAKTQPVMIPADADIVVEGLMRTDVLEPEAPFGESHGYMNPREYNMIVDVTAITRRTDAVYTSFISQVAPSESSCIRKVAWEPLFEKYLRDECNISALKNVGLHEPLTSVHKVVVLQMEADARPSEVWRALNAAKTFRPTFGKLTVAVDPDIDPDNPDAVFWAMAFRSKPHEDMQVIEKQQLGHGPKQDPDYDPSDAAVLWDATLDHANPPLSLPKREYMERAREIWEDAELPDLDPQMPWYGYSMGEWNERLELEAERAVNGEYFETGAELVDRRVSADEVQPNTRVFDEDEFPDGPTFEGL